MRYIITLRGRWPELKVKLKARFQNLTDDDFKLEHTSQQEEMMDALQAKLGMCRQELIRTLNRL